MAKAARKRHTWRRRLLTGCGLLALVFLLVTLLPVLLLRWLPPPTSAFMLGHWIEQQGQTQAWTGHPRYQWVGWHDIAPAMRIAVVAAEDQKFPHHSGFDVASIRDAIRDHLRGGSLRGASTISQQVAKNLFLCSRQSWLRKGLEAWFTLLIELSWPKQRILEVYLNIAEFGPGIYGVEAAAREYHATSAAALTPRQAALLATVLPNPKYFDAAAPTDYMLNRRDWILRHMSQLGGPAYVSDMPE